VWNWSLRPWIFGGSNCEAADTQSEARHGASLRAAAVGAAATAEEHRRSQRVLVRMPVIITWPGKVLPGNTHTVSAGAQW